MSFNSHQFLVFLPLVIALYYIVGERYKNILLLIASYIFYASWDPRFLLLLIISTLIDYCAGLMIYQSTDSVRRRAYLFISIFMNLGILGFFKYYNFFGASLISLLHFYGFDLQWRSLTNIVLPVGISFYTFQTMSYTIDVYRGNFQPRRNIVNFALYVAFFPQLVAGPIERSHRLLPQLERSKHITSDMLKKGAMLIIIGFIKKCVIADNLGFFVDECFRNYHNIPSAALIAALGFFALQVYCDFSGYSDIARGAAYFLGVELMVNFRQPFFSVSLQEFWSRWHISFTTWLKDYLYKSIGGSKKGNLRTVINVAAVFLLGGLWHGAAWAYVLWGAYFAILLLLEVSIFKYYGFKPMMKLNSPFKFMAGLGRMFVVFSLFAISAILFRGQHLSIAIGYGRAILTNSFSLSAVPPALVMLALFLFLIDFLQYRSKDETTLVNLPSLAYWSIAALGVMLIILLGSNSELPFIYYQF